MSSNISNPTSLSKRGGLLPVRRASQAETWLKSLRERFHAWRALRAAEDELFALSDRDLADIGLSRHSIRSAVRGEACR